jgi:hypothetical protein
MPYTAQQTITIRGPQWATDPRINDLIALAQQGLAAAVFGDRYGEAVGLKVLHQLALEARNGGNPGTGTSSGSGFGGIITSEREGDLARSYGIGGSGGSGGFIDELDSTQYGQELKRLIRACIFMPMNRRM